MGQGVFPFKYEAVKKTTGITALGVCWRGLPGSVKVGYRGISARSAKVPRLGDE